MLMSLAQLQKRLRGRECRGSGIAYSWLSVECSGLPFRFVKAGMSKHQFAFRN